MIQRATPPPRGPRHVTSGPRGAGRGGVQKRRGPGGPVRVDKDGDLVMNGSTATDRQKSGRGRIESSTSSRPQGAGRGGPHSGSGRGGNLATHRQQQAILRGMASKDVTISHSRNTFGSLRIKGLSSSRAARNPDGGLESLLGFLERKASGLEAKSNKTVKIKKSCIVGDCVIIWASQEDIDTIQKLNGFTFALSELSIEACDPVDLKPISKGNEKDNKEISSEAQKLKEQIKAVLSTRYDVDLKLLNLSALGKDSYLLQIGLFEAQKSVSKLFPALMAVCEDIFTTRSARKDAVLSVTLAGNELIDVSKVTALAGTFPDLKNLDLSGNQYGDLKSLSDWRYKFRQLENLVLTGNPIETQSPGYQDELIRWYPRLQLLNGVQVRTAEEIAAASAHAANPIPISPPDFRDVSQVGENFVRRFFSLYDNNRAGLLTNFYDAKSIFSLSINMISPRDPQNRLPIPPWAAYTRHNRNLFKFTHLGARISRSHRGKDAIQTLWTELPATQHPDLSTKSNKYLIECHPLPGLSDPSGQTPLGIDGLLLTVHGEFEEENATKSFSEKAMRSFSRTFVLGPGAPGGPQIRVVSDTMVLRVWAPLATPWMNISPASSMANGNVAQSGEQSMIMQPAMPNGNVVQSGEQAMIMELVNRTGMNPEYAEMCLKEVGADLDRAVVAFNLNKANLPADAFINGMVPA